MKTLCVGIIESCYGKLFLGYLGKLMKNWPEMSQYEVRYKLHFSVLLTLIQTMSKLRYWNVSGVVNT